MSSELTEAHVQAVKARAHQLVLLRDRFVTILAVYGGQVSFDEMQADRLVAAVGQFLPEQSA